jgi:hypothetical protein
LLVVVEVEMVLLVTEVAEAEAQADIGLVSWEKPLEVILQWKLEQFLQL